MVFDLLSSDDDDQVLTRFTVESVVALERYDEGHPDELVLLARVRRDVQQLPLGQYERVIEERLLHVVRHDDLLLASRPRLELERAVLPATRKREREIR